jgi:two-component system chemotaxis sensor kinase CheA
MEEVIKEFLVESYENLDRLDQALVELEKDPRHKESLNSIFRTIHTIKGTCGFLGFNKLQRIAHAGENLLSRLRDGVLILDSPITDGLLAMVDAIRKALSIIESTNKEGTEEHPELVEKLARLTEGKPESAATPVAAPAMETKPVTPPAAKIPEVAALPPLVANPPAATATLPKVSANVTDKKTTVTARVLPVASPDAPPPSVRAEPSQEASAVEKPEARGGGMSDSTIRVGVTLLDKLMNLVGELVLARNEILELTNSRSDPLSLRVGQRLNLITTELQESVMKTRMQAIDSVWGKLPRMVRDVATELGKRVRLEMSGNETELDRSVIESIKDPLTHIIRNSIDHGIENPQKRRTAGKPEEGLLRLRAFHEGGQVNIEITDDGAGIDVERVKAKALNQGMISESEAAGLTEREAISLIFRPGFSTAETVTSVSGRGVGMDVVRSNIKKIGGTVDISTEKGQGTKIKIKIPLTLAIIPALIITTCGERFAIPQVSLLELVRLDGDQPGGGIETVFGSPVYRLRGKLLPLVYLRQILKLEPGQFSSAQPPRDKTEGVVNIVVLQADSQAFGLVVEEVNDTQEIVVKPLGKHLKGIPVFAGATIMGDGRLALILDVLGLAYTAQVITKARDLRLIQQAREGQAAGAAAAERLLIFDVDREHRMAIPLSSVWRLERFPHSAIEKEGDHSVVQYRGQIMPLAWLSQFHGGTSLETTSDADLQVVIHSKQGRCVGLVVGQIVDIVEPSEPIEKRSGRPGVLGAAVIHGRVTEVLDIPAMMQTFHHQLALAD